MHKVLILFMSLVLIACATTMPGTDVSTGSDKLSATVDEHPHFSDDRIQMLQFSLKNKTDDWMEFDGGSIEDGANVSVLMGDRISTWIEACTLEKNVSDYNTSLLLGSLAIGGAVVAGGSQHAQTSATGAVIALGSISALGARDIMNSKRKTEFQRAFPEKHIFQSFVVPPQKVIQRWILVENPKGDQFTLKLKNKAGNEVALKVGGLMQRQY